LEEQKGYDIALDVCEKLIDSGAPIEWFVLGDGTQRSWIESEIQKRKLVGKMHLLGVRMNPYPYFKNCDIYVQTSKHEGWGITITEAKILQKPIVTTDFAGAREQIVDEVSGDIADINDDSVFKKLERLIKEDERRISYSDELSKEVNSEEPEWISVFE
jgi:glycosyltransferase involved in cell wall biosynthesis